MCLDRMAYIPLPPVQDNPSHKPIENKMKVLIKDRRDDVPSPPCLVMGFIYEYFSQYKGKTVSKIKLRPPGTITK